MSTIQKYSRFAESDDFLFEIAKGNVKGHFCLNKYGENNAVGTTNVTIWDGVTAYTYIDTAQKIKISSDDANDTNEGTGVHYIRISGLDENWNYVSENVYLNGLTPVETENTYIRIFRGSSKLAGSNNAAHGSIYAGTGTVTDGVPANIHMKILAENGQTQMSILSIPAGYTGYLMHATGSVGLGKEYHAGVWNRLFGSNIWNKVGSSILVEQSYDRIIKTPIPIPEKTDIEFRGFVDSTPVVFVTGTFDIVLVKKNDTYPDIIQ